MKRKKLLFTLAIPVLLCQNLQAQTSSRLVGQAHSTNDGAVFQHTDSTAYSYSGTRGGDLKHTLKYDNSTNWVYVGDTAYANNTNDLQDFNADNTINSHTSRTWSGSAWVNYTKQLYFYDASGTMTNMITQYWGGSNWVNITNNLYTYDAGGHLYSDQYQIWNSGTSAFDPSSQKIYFYDGSGNVTQQVNQNYNTTLGAFDYSDRFVYTYSATAQQLSITYSTWNGASWDNANMYTNSYDSLGNRVAQLYQTYDGTSAAWVNSTQQLYSNFASGMPLTQINQTWDATSGGMWDNTMEYTYMYNSDNQMTSAVGESWNVAGFWEFANGDPSASYYYSDFSNTSVATVNKGGDASIYPVPAQNTLHIDLNWNEAQAATITIMDVQGRIVNQLQTPSAAQYSTTISVNTLAAGMYIVKINGTQGQIVKQIVVAH